jgi:hypothetical protein
MVFSKVTGHGTIFQLHLPPKYHNEVQRLRGMSPAQIS